MCGWVEGEVVEKNWGRWKRRIGGRGKRRNGGRGKRRVEGGKKRRIGGGSEGKPRVWFLHSCHLVNQYHTHIRLIHTPLHFITCPRL